MRIYRISHNQKLVDSRNENYCTHKKPSPFRLLDIFESTVKLFDGNGFNNDKMKERLRKKNESKQNKD